MPGVPTRPVAPGSASAPPGVDAAGGRLLPVFPGAAGVWLAGVGLALLLGLLASTARNWAALVATIAVLAVGALFARVLGPRPGLVVLLIVTATIDRFTFPVGSLSLRAEQIAALAALLVLMVAAFRERRWGWLKPNLAEAFLLAWLVCNVVSSLLASPDRRLSAKILAVIAISSLGLFLPRRLLFARGAIGDLETIVHWLLVVFATEAGYSTAVYLLHAFGPTVGLGINPASGYLSAYGTLWEQNVLGALSAAGLVAWTYLGPRRFRSAWVGAAACIGGSAASVTRAAWLAAVVVGSLALLIPGNRRRLDLRALAKSAAGGLVVIAVTLVAVGVGSYNHPLAPAAGSGTPGGSHEGFLAAILNRVDLLGRFNQVSQVWDDIRDHLILGRGTAAFEALHQFKSVPEHLASLPLNVLDGTGLAGVALFTAFAAAVFVRAWSRRGDDLVHALGQVCLVIAFTNISTETLELMIGWLLIGMLLLAIDRAGAPGISNPVGRGDPAPPEAPARRG